MFAVNYTLRPFEARLHIEPLPQFEIFWQLMQLPISATAYSALPRARTRLDFVRGYLKFRWCSAPPSRSAAIYQSGGTGNVTESTIIATIHCPDVGYCLFGISLVTHILYHVPCTFLIVIVSYWVVLSFTRLFTPLTPCTQ